MYARLILVPKEVGPLAEGLLSPEYLTMIVTGFLVGTLARAATIKEDTRQYPSYPNGYLINLVTGGVAAVIGAVFLPALLTKNFIGVSFLVLAVQQFRDVRKMERESLKDLEHTEFNPRGNAYIDGIAKTFEMRNYISLLCALICTLTMELIPGHRPLFDIPAGGLAAFLTLFLLSRLTKGKTVQDIADVQLAPLSVRGNMLYVEQIPLANIGLPDVQERFLKEGLGVLITPHSSSAQIALANYGQRQAIVHEAARSFGLKRYVYMRRDFDRQRIGFALIPIRGDGEALLKIVRHVPLIESTRKTRSMRKAKILPGQESED